VRAPRLIDGSAADTLAFLVNATAEEVERLVSELEHEQRAREDAQEQLLKNAKLAALGRLAGGVAHELNQPLTVIRMVTDLLLEKNDTRISQCRADLELVSSAAGEMAAIVGKVRAFAGPRSFALSALPALAPVDAALAELLPELESLGIQVERSSAPDLPAVLADHERLELVFFNLLANARDALSETAPGHPRRITVTIRTLDDHVEYAISDSGRGVALEHRERIFEPFFTTKPVGRNKGLGLSVSLGIVGDHGGDLRCDPLAEGGARFLVRIPVAAGKHEP
jgi:C4-dicarboxylate-specific signal transduction histidine kinase